MVVSYGRVMASDSEAIQHTESSAMFSFCWIASLRSQ